eukprot:gene53505-biopygen113516
MLFGTGGAENARSRIERLLGYIAAPGRQSCASGTSDDKATLHANVTFEVGRFLGVPPGGGPADPPLPDRFAGLEDDVLRNLAETRECLLCGEKGERLRRCTGCRSVWYCSTVCQKGHWPSHKPACRGQGRGGSAAVVALAAAAAASAMQTAASVPQARYLNSFLLRRSQKNLSL